MNLPGNRRLDTPERTSTRDIHLDDAREDPRDTTPEADREHRVMTEPTVAPAVVDRARGGVSMGSVVTGVLVAFGAFIILSAMIGAILTALGVTEGGINANEARSATIGMGIGLVVAQFLAYLWGGYTAGRMARGSGFANGLLVPIVGLIFVAALGALVAAITGNLDVQASAETAQAQLPLPLSDLADIGTGVGIGVLVAMLLGGMLGGRLGHRWHTKLEDAETTL